VIRAYFNQKAAVWDETVAESDTTKLERMARRLAIRPGSTVLDVGTGTGVFLPFLLGEAGEKGRIVALDLAEEMLKIVRAKGFNSNIAYLHADVTSIPLGGEIFDAVVCYSSFPHFQDKPRALAEMKRVTRSGGGLFICHTSSRAKINQIHRRIPVVQNDIIPDAEEMHALLMMEGFIDIEVEDNDENYLARARKPKGDDNFEV
jgi:ubiquinone/menaquinone biosynthesis C-methylase UbiE